MSHRLNFRALRTPSGEGLPPAYWEAVRRPARPPRPAAIRGPEREYTEQQLEEMLGVNDLFRD